MKIAFFTGHMAGMPRKASLALLADAYCKMGWDVRIVTTGYSIVSELIRDPRCAYAKTRPFNRWFDVAPLMKGYIQRSLINPGRFPISFLNRWTEPFFDYYSSRLSEAVIAELQDADIICVESGAGLLYTANLKKYCPNAKLIYVASDSLIALQVHPVIMKAEKKYLPLFDFIICPAQREKEFNHPHFFYIPQGIDTNILDTSTENPYSTENNIISVGDMLFDARAVMTLAKACPDWTIHLFGAKACCPEALSNIVTHGEVAFHVTAPYIMHADIGLAPYKPVPDAAYLSQSSLKMKQYTYAGLSIIAPDFATANYPHAIPYNPHDLSSIAGAFERARHYDRRTISKAGIISWKESAQKILDVVDVHPSPRMASL